MRPFYFPLVNCLFGRGVKFSMERDLISLLYPLTCILSLFQKTPHLDFSMSSILHVLLCNTNCCI